MRTQVDEQPVAELVSVAYFSTATTPFTGVDLAALLLQSRMKNAARGLTGMLLHRNGQFMQVLEGPRDVVRVTLSVIEADPRHEAIWLLDEQPIANRRFGSWAMGYREIAEGEEPPVWYGSPEAIDRAAGAAGSPRAVELLAWFRDR